MIDEEKNNNNNESKNNDISIKVNYGKKQITRNKTISLNKQITHVAPTIQINGRKNNEYSFLIMSDPNAVGGNRIHWLVVNIVGNDILTGVTSLFMYVGPNPPINTGIHHYFFSLYGTKKKFSKEEIHKMDDMLVVVKRNKNNNRQKEIKDILKIVDKNAKILIKSVFFTIDSSKHGTRKKQK